MAKWTFTYETHNERIYLICPSVKGDLLVFQDANQGRSNKMTDNIPFLAVVADFTDRWLSTLWLPACPNAPLGLELK